jgi:nucleoid-associated protein YgaU
MVDQSVLNLIVMFLWLGFASMVILVNARKLSVRKVKKAAFITGGISTLATISFQAPTPVYAQSIDSDSWKIGEVEIDVSTTTTALLAPLPSIVKEPEQIDQTPISLGEQKYIVKPGDNLWSIAKANASDGEDFVVLWEEIISTNKNSLKSKNPDLIYPGEEIIIKSNV